jgi:APA family basic amino acid/polyamine antiporter
LQSSPLPAALAVAPIFGQKSLAIIALLALLVLVSCLNANIMLTPRILYGLARDSLLPRSLTRVNRGGSPDLALFISMGVSGLLILTGQFETVFLLVGAFTIVAFLVVDAAFFVLRWREPDLPRPFRAKCYPWLPAFALALDAALLGAFAWADPRSLIYVGLCLLAAMPFALFAAKRARNFASVL